MLYDSYTMSMGAYVLLLLKQCALARKVGVESLAARVGFVGWFSLPQKQGGLGGRQAAKD